MAQPRGLVATTAPGVLLALIPLAVTGCVERLIEVRSDPPGAAVTLNGTDIGATPLEHSFTHYGTVEVILRREGCLSQRELVTLRPPWYEVFPFDIFSELLVPATLHDRHELDVKLVATSGEGAGHGGMGSTGGAAPEE